MKYYDVAEVFAEIPTEISLAINLTGCPHRCKGCHSPWLREDIGQELTISTIKALIDAHPGISCILFMGGDAYPAEIVQICQEIRRNFPNFKLAVYSGDDALNVSLLNVLDYYKVGSYQEDKGPLDSPTTNQRLYKVENARISDITSMFWKKLD